MAVEGTVELLLLLVVVVSVFVLMAGELVEDPCDDSVVLVESEGAVVGVAGGGDPPDFAFGFDFVFDFGGIVVIG